ncbi:MAG: hypothetical protein LBU17_03150 [Treponema sp.]|nr:hypothetical protein [Treponema sp.]
MGWLQRSFVYIIIALFFLSCGKSGNIFAFVDDTTFNNSIASLIPTPVRREYVLKDLYTPKTELTVHVVYADGSTQEIPIEQVMLTLKEDEAEATLGEAYRFDIPGEKLITVSYESKIARFTVMVRDPSANSGSGSNSEDGDTSLDLTVNLW